MSLKDKTQSLFAEKFGYPATHVIGHWPRKPDW